MKIEGLNMPYHVSGEEKDECGNLTLNPACSPDDIEKRSFAIIDSAFPQKPFGGNAWEIARRLVHSSGDLGIAQRLSLPDVAIDSGIAAIRAGARIYTDTEMVRAGIPIRRLEKFGCTVRCILAANGIAELASAKGITRSRAGMELLQQDFHGAVIAIGNAPTALLALLDAVRSKGIRPALVIGMPVGFVNAAESKELLLRHKEIPSLVLRGKRGGSPLAAATVNALAVIAARPAMG